jgi:hypothetical protein
VRRSNELVLSNNHPLDLCANHPEKFDNSSRAMESMGLVKMILNIWKECPNTYVAAIVA